MSRMTRKELNLLNPRVLSGLGPPDAHQNAQRRNASLTCAPATIDPPSRVGIIYLWIPPGLGYRFGLRANPDHLALAFAPWTFREWNEGCHNAKSSKKKRKAQEWRQCEALFLEHDPS